MEEFGPTVETVVFQFSIMNLNSVKKLFDMGMRPVYRQSDDEKWRRIPQAPTVEASENGMRLNFQFVLSANSSSTSNDRLDETEVGTKSKPAPMGKYFFAYTMPYTYTTLQSRLDALENHYGLSTITKTDFKPVSLGSSTKSLNRKSRIPVSVKPSISRSTSTLSASQGYSIVNKAGKHSSIYFRRELLTTSLDGHRLDLLTISSTEGMIDNPAREAAHPDLFPDGPSSRSRVFHMAPPLNQNSKDNTTPATGKKFFVITARVHPAETVSSFVLDGFLDFILCEHDPRAAALRSRFVFKIIPMLNPDGCVRGHYRDDARGVNLNRVYGYPHPKFHPTIFATKTYIVDICAASGELGFYIDLHGHANKPGCFLFANRAAGMISRADVWNFGKRMKDHCPWFDLRECDFSADSSQSSPGRTASALQEMSLKDDQKKTLPEETALRTKEGTGRVAIYNATGCIHTYTFEANYHSARHGLGWTGPVKNTAGFPNGAYCPPAVKCSSQECALGRAIQGFTRGFQPAVRGTGFTLGDLHSMGRSIALSALDASMYKKESKG